MSIFSWPKGREQRLPEMKRRPPLKRLMVREQWFVQSLQVAGRASWVNSSKSFAESRADLGRPSSFAARAAP